MGEYIKIRDANDLVQHARSGVRSVLDDSALNGIKKLLESVKVDVGAIQKFVIDEVRYRGPVLSAIFSLFGLSLVRERDQTSVLCDERAVVNPEIEGCIVVDKDRLKAVLETSKDVVAEQLERIAEREDALNRLINKLRLENAEIRQQSEAQLAEQKAATQASRMNVQQLCALCLARGERGEAERIVTLSGAQIVWLPESFEDSDRFVFTQSQYAPDQFMDQVTLNQSVCWVTRPCLTEGDEVLIKGCVFVQATEQVGQEAQA